VGGAVCGHGGASSGSATARARGRGAASWVVDGEQRGRRCDAEVGSVRKQKERSSEEKKGRKGGASDMTECLGPHHDFATIDIRLSRLVIDISIYKKKSLRLVDCSSFLHCNFSKSHKVAKFLDRLKVVKL